MRMSEANNFDPKANSQPSSFKKKMAEALKDYLNMPKQIFQQAASLNHPSSMDTDYSRLIVFIMIL